MTENLRQVGQRLKTYMQTRGLTINGLAHMTRFTAPELDAIIDGGQYPVSRLMHVLDLFTDVNPAWLLRGEEPMLRAGVPAPHAKRELADDIEAREVLRRHAQVPEKNPLAPRVAALEAQVQTLQETLARLHLPKPKTGKKAAKAARRAQSAT